MEFASRRGIRAFLAVLLAVSLLGTNGMQIISQAFASEDEDNATQQQATSSSDEAQENETASIDEGDDLTAAEEEPSPAELADQSSAAYEATEPGEALEEASENEIDVQTLDTSGPRYVYEYVYGIFGTEYTIASDEKSSSYGISRESEGVLLSATKGQIFPDGITVSADAVNAVLEGSPSIVFKQNGKYGLMEYSTQKVTLEPAYDIACIYPGGDNKDRWGFIQLGSQAQDGTYPSATAVICSQSTELFKVNLPGYLEKGSIGYGISYPDGSSSWYVGWSASSDSSSSYGHLYINENENGFEVDDRISSQGTNSRTSTTPDGHKVTFTQANDEPVMISVTDPDGTKHEDFALETSQTNWNSFRTVSNLIEVSGSGGYSYQYFMLDGSLLQNVNGSRYEQLGNYVSFTESSFESLERTQVFLDTSGKAADPVEMPAIAGSFPNGYSSSSSAGDIFECISPENKLQRYDRNLNKLLEFDTSLDMKASYDQGTSSIELGWSLSEPFEGAWLIEEWIGRSYAPSANALRIIKGSTILDSKALGLASPRLFSKGSYGGYLYLISYADPCYMRFYRSDLSPYKELDLAPYVQDGYSISSVSLSEYGSSMGLSLLSIGSRNDSSQYSYKNVILDSKLDFTEYENLHRLSDDVYAAEKNGKWGFVSSDLTPRGEFIFERIYSIWNEDGITLFEAFADNRYRIFDQDLNDVFGIAVDSFDSIGNQLYLVDYDGNSHLYREDLTGRFTEMSLRGYQLAKDGWGSSRVLLDGTLMLYVKDAQGNIGAIDDAGKVIIPIEYKSFAEDMCYSNDSDYIMLRDDGGWFFVPVSSLQASAPNDDCETLGHDWEESVYQPTCTTDGYTQKVCKRCGFAYRVEGSTVPALGHDFVLTSAAVEPTCTEDGHEDEFTCNNCGETEGGEVRKNLGGHVLPDSNWEVTEYPTCTEPGTYQNACTRCGEIVQEAIPAYGHSWSSLYWDWSSDYQACTAQRSCSNCGDEENYAATVTHEEVANGMRHSAVAKIDGINQKDGRMTLGWIDANGIARNLLVKGAPVADGFYAWPQGLELPADASNIEISVTPVTYGGVFDALVSKIGDGWPAGTFDVRLNVDGTDLHEDFGMLSFAFPGGPASPGKKAVVHHCHKDDRHNITSHESFVTSDGMILLGGIIDLSTFALEVLEEDSGILSDFGDGPSRGNYPVGDLPQTGDEKASAVFTLFAIAELALSFGIASLLIWRKRKAA